MEPNVVCSEDQSSPAVCCCFCRFPLPALCEEHLAKHPTDTEGFLHFHLPLAAQHHISTKEIKALYDPWLYKLYRAGTLLKENNGDLNQFENQIEANKQEILIALETEFAQAKQKVANLREAFNAQLQTAIIDTNSHAMEQWTPEPGSLSSLIWNFDVNNPSSLKLFGLWAGKQPSARVLQIYIESSFTSLAQFNQSIDEPKEQVFQQTQLELVESNQRNEESKAENAKLREEIRNLQVKYNNLSETIESLKDSTEVHIKKGKKEKEKIKLDCNAKIKQLKLELAKLKKNNKEQVKKLNEEINTFKSDSKEMQLIKEQTEATFRYEQRASSLRKEWNSIKNKAVAYQKTANVGLALGEVLGVHLCQFDEAERVINESLRVVTARIRTSEVEMRLQTLKAAIHFHNYKNSDCEAACVETLETFESANFETELYWTTLSYLAFALCNQSKYTEAETALRDWSTKPLLRNNDSLKQFLELYVRGRGELANKEKKAEYSFKKAAQIAAQHFPTSICAAMNLLYLGRHYYNENQMEEAKVTLIEANSIFSVQFPFSYYSALTLIWITCVFEKSGKLVEGCSKRIEAHSILTRYYPSSKHTAVNLTNIANLCYNMDRLEDAEQTYLQACDLYEANDPTSDNAAMNFYNLATSYEMIGRSEEAFACATSAFDIWNTNKSENAQKLALPLLEQLK